MKRFIKNLQYLSTARISDCLAEMRELAISELPSGMSRRLWNDL